MLRAIRGLRDGPPREDARRAGARWAIATAITLVFFAVLGSAVVSVRDLLEPRRTSDGQLAPSTPPPERIVYVPMPRSATQPVVPLSPAAEPSATTRAPSPRSTARPDSGGPVPIAPPTARSSDSATLAPTPAPDARSSSAAAIEDPRVVFPTVGCDLACRLKRGGGGTGGATGNLSTAQRDSALREAARRAREAQRLPAESPAGPPMNTNAPQPMGTSIGVPLPGGGPSAAERKRNRELDAEISARLARIKARADSAQRAKDSTKKER